ncbi:MAG TPA: CocE/NonD family hydrolase, partial [Rhodanobacter sp.]|nr:CocE/NonD family hydrolase [Rhodanobacter sp.]
MTSSRFVAGLRPALFALLLATGGMLQAADAPQAKYPNYPSETPAKFVPVTDSFDYVKRDVMIPMRDGVKLHTVILIPKSIQHAGASHAGILLTRTPYDAKALTTHTMSGHLGPMLEGYDNVADIIVEDGYIRVVQDVRGKYGSEGDYVMNRPLHGPLNPTPVDDATDTYDTIDWLVKNIPESNGKVGTLGISYDGFEPLMALFNPHPALKVSVPMNPMVDGWMGDDWFHNGAFRQQNLAYMYEQTASRDNSIKWWTSYHDEYDLFMHYGSAGALADAYGMRQLGFWNKLLAHPAYDSFWSEQAVDKLLAREPLKVPVMLVHSLWDQEDIYGALAVYRAIKPKDSSGNMVRLVMGPWHHGQEIDEGSSLGAIRFGSDTAKYFREKILRPYL